MTIFVTKRSPQQGLNEGKAGLSQMAMDSTFGQPKHPHPTGVLLLSITQQNRLWTHGVLASADLYNDQETLTDSCHAILHGGPDWKPYF